MEGTSLGRTFGYLSGILLVLGSIVTFVFGVVFAILNQSASYGLGKSALAVEEFVVGVLVVVITFYSATPQRDARIGGGIVLIVLGIASFLFLEFRDVLPVLGALLALIAGVLFVVSERPLHRL